MFFGFLMKLLLKNVASCARLNKGGGECMDAHLYRVVSHQVHSLCFNVKFIPDIF